MFRHSRVRFSANRESREMMTYSLIEARVVAAKRALLSPPLWGRAEEGGTTNSGVCGLSPSLTLPHKGGGNPSAVLQSQRPA
jgi:hypothetical protein